MAMRPFDLVKLLDFLFQFAYGVLQEVFRRRAFADQCDRLFGGAPTRLGHLVLFELDRLIFHNDDKIQHEYKVAL